MSEKMKKHELLSDVSWELLQRFLLNKEVKTRSGYLITIDKFLVFLGRDLVFATVNDCRNFIHTLQKKVKYSTLYKEYTILHSIYNFFLHEGAVIENHFSKLVIPAPNQSINKVLTQENQVILFNYLKEHDPVCFAAAILALKTLLTTTEICSLAVEDISIENKTLYLKTKYKQIYNLISDDMLPYLKHYISSLGDSIYLFPGTRDKNNHIPTRTLLNRLEIACSKCNIGKITFNDLRNTGIANSVSNGIDDTTLTGAIDMKSNLHAKRLRSYKEPNPVANYINPI